MSWPVWCSQRQPYYAFQASRHSPENNNKPNTRAAGYSGRRRIHRTLIKMSTSNGIDSPSRDLTGFQSNLSQRLTTFYPVGGGPSLWTCRHVYPDALVRAGFIYSGKNDLVHCVFCRRTLSQWEEGDDPKQEHIKHFPDCPGIKNNWLVPRPTVSAAESTSHRRTSTPQSSAPRRQQSPPVPARSPEHYMDLASRLASYDTPPWPHSSGKLTAQHMAKAGFYYTGERDRVQCYMCKCQLHSWDPNDDPILEHQRWFPDCPIVKDYERTLQNPGAVSSSPGVRVTITTCRGNSMVQEGGPRAGIPVVADSVGDADVEQLSLVLENEFAAISLGEHGVTEHELKTAASVDKDPFRSEAKQQGAVDSLCAICLDKDKSIAFIPCGHVTCCTDCAYHVSSCPLCRKGIQNRIKIYL